MLSTVIAGSSFIGSVMIKFCCLDFFQRFKPHADMP